MKDFELIGGRWEWNNIGWEMVRKIQKKWKEKAGSFILILYYITINIRDHEFQNYLGINW